MSDRRTTQQNKALHKFFEMLADSLNEQGLDMRVVLKEDAEIPWTKESVKNHLWRPLQKALEGKESTTEMDTKDPSEIHQVLMKHLGEKLGVPYIDFPSQR